jgi:hypothetical protein
VAQTKRGVVYCSSKTDVSTERIDPPSKKSQKQRHTEGTALPEIGRNIKYQHGVLWLCLTSRVLTFMKRIQVAAIYRAKHHHLHKRHVTTVELLLTSRLWDDLHPQ